MSKPPTKKQQRAREINYTLFQIRGAMAAVGNSLNNKHLTAEARRKLDLADLQLRLALEEVYAIYTKGKTNG